MPNDLHLMATSVDGMSRGHLYNAGQIAARLRAKNSRAVALRGLALYCVDANERMMQRVEVTVSSVFDAFDEYMRRFFDQNYLVDSSYTNDRPRQSCYGYCRSLDIFINYISYRVGGP